MEGWTFNLLLLAVLQWLPLPSARQHQSFDDCLEVKREYYQNSCVLDCVTQNFHSPQHTYVSSSYRSKQIGFVTLGPLRLRRSGCLELYYCNMAEWFWWDSNLISTTNWFPSVLWHCWFGHLACKTRPRMTYNVWSGTLNLTHSLTVAMLGRSLMSVNALFAPMTLTGLLWRRNLT